MCPYCNSTKISQPKPVVTFGAEALIAMGIKVPHIRQCESCTATFAAEVFVADSAQWQAQRELAHA